MSHCLLCHSMPSNFQVISSDVEAKSNLNEMVLCQEIYIPMYPVYILKAAVLIKNSRHWHPSLSIPTAKRVRKLSCNLHQQHQHNILLKCIQSHILTVEIHCSAHSSHAPMRIDVSVPTLISIKGAWDCVFSMNKLTGLHISMSMQEVILCIQTGSKHMWKEREADILITLAEKMK